MSYQVLTPLGIATFENYEDAKRLSSQEGYPMKKIYPLGDCLTKKQFKACRRTLINKNNLKT